MSVIVSSPEGIHDSALNNSTSKALYSFPKATRFKDIGRRNDNPNAFYDIGDTKTRRTTSFGYGNKQDFTKSTDKVPAPNHYANTDSMYKFGRKGITMGPGRDTVTFSGFTVKQKKVPGPGAYDVQSRNLPHLKGFQMKQKSESLKKHWNIVLGLERYKVIQKLCRKTSILEVSPPKWVEGLWGGPSARGRRPLPDS